MSMPRFMIERHFGQVTPEEIVWEHSHAVTAPDGLVTYCIYQAPNEKYVRDHATAAGLPCDRVQVIANTVGPDDFR
jgi:hypothetical protein